MLGELVERIEAIGTPAEHPWRGVGLASILPNESERLLSRLTELDGRLLALRERDETLAGMLAVHPAAHLADMDATVALARRVAGAPDLAEALGAEVWDDSGEAIGMALSSGAEHAAARSELATTFSDTAWSTELGEARAGLAKLPAEFGQDGFAAAEELARFLPRLMAAAAALARSLGREQPRTLAEAEHMALVGERVAAAPAANPEVFAADLWHAGLERASDLTTTVPASRRRARSPPAPCRMPHGRPTSRAPAPRSPRTAPASSAS